MNQGIIYIILLFCFNTNAQSKFELNHNIYSIKDSLSGVVYGFDSASKKTNIFDRGKLNYKVTGYQLVSNISAKMKFIKTVKIKNAISGFKDKKIKGQILMNEKELSDKSCWNFDILFGNQFLKNYIISFDNKESRFEILEELPQNIDQFNKLNLTYNMLVDDYFVNLKINNVELEFLIDTASSNGISCNDSTLLNKVKNTYIYNTLNAFTIQEQKVTEYNLNSIFHHDFRIKNDIVHHQSIKNIIGNSFFLNFENVIFDFKNKTIYLKNEFRQMTPFSDDILFTANSNNQLEIGFLNTNSIYYKQGFRLGDIIKFDDKNFENKILSNPCQAQFIINEHLKNNHSLPSYSKG